MGISFQIPVSTMITFEAIEMADFKKKTLSSRNTYIYNVTDQLFEIKK